MTTVDTDTIPTSWTPVDLNDALAGREAPPPDLLHRTDGFPLLYRGKVHVFHGESESCKSWAAQVAAVEVIQAGGRVLYIDFEDDANGVVPRLRTLGLTSDQIKAGFVYIHPDEPLMDRRTGKVTQAYLDFAEQVDGRAFDLAVIDGVTEAMTIEDLEVNSNGDIAEWQRILPKWIARTTGAAVVVIDHVTKNSETRGRFSIGGQHKISGISGAAYAFNTVRPFHRATNSEPVAGQMTVTVGKDRPGYVRGRTVESKVGMFELTAYPDGGVTARIIPPGEVEFVPPAALLERIVDHLGMYDGASKRSIEDTVEGNTNTIRATLRWMRDRDWIRIEEKGRSHLHYLTDKGRGEG